MLLTVASIYIHEYGHVWAAKKLGHKFHGFIYKWYGMGAKIELKNQRDLWKIASAGLIVTAALAAFSYPFINYLLINYLFTLNLMILLINIIPLGPSDGAQIVRGLRAQRTDPASHTDQLR